VNTPGVHNPRPSRGRKYGSRPGVSADWDRRVHGPHSARTSDRKSTAIRPPGHDYAWPARRGGRCLFALDSDAHSTAELRYAETAIAHARLAGVPVETDVNCWAGRAPAEVERDPDEIAKGRPEGRPYVPRYSDRT